MITGGHNLGRVGTITSRERHPGSFDIVHIKDALGHTFATRYVSQPVAESLARFGFNVSKPNITINKMC